MAVYFDNRIQSSSVTANTDLLWHDKYALLAVASENSGGVGGAVNFYLDEGELLEESSLQRSSLVSSMSWHPVRKIIAVGWASGELLIWNEHDKDLHEVYSVHKGKVKIAKWSPNGERLVTGDEEGLLAIWKADNRGRLSQTPLYQHDCSSAITYCLFKPNTGQDHAMDITSLARAAVNGDERALDMFAWTKGKRPLANSSATNTFFFGTADGNVFFVDDKGHSKTSFAVDASVKILLYYEAKDVLVTVTENMMLTQHSLEHDGSTKEIMKVKISGGFADSCIIWAGSGVLANASGENVVRILDLEQNDNYVLSLDMAGYDKGESVTSISYSRVKGILAGGTNLGKVAMWKSAKNKTGIHVDGEKRWELLPPSVINEPVLQVQWGGGKGLLGANVGSSVVILNEQVMNVHFNNMVAAIQISPSQLTIENFATDFCQDLKTDIHIKGVFILKDHAIVWDGKRVVVYEVSADITMVRAAGSFSSDSFTVVAHDQSVYTVEPGKIQVRNFQGTVKQVLSFHDTEGEPMLIDICGSFLVAATTLGFIKMWDLSRREAKQHGMCRSFEAQVPGVGKIKSAKINCNGTKVCIICEKDESTNDPRLFIWDVELDVVQIFDFSTGRNDQITEQENRDDRFDQVSGRYPMLQYWDPTEPKLLSCQAVLAPVTVVSGNEGAKPKDVSHQNIADVLIVTLYHTPENGIILLDHFVEEEQYTGFLGVQIPYFYFSVKRTEALEEKKDVGGTFVPLGPHRMTTRRTMKDFIGLEDASSEAKQAMMDFSYLSAIGNMDEAFKAIKLIKSESVWQNMARMCVKTKRLDVASVCLGNMKNARAAKALKKAMKEPELDARVAMLAIQLNMLDEAERLYKSCKRFDLLNEFYQARNEWSKAVEVAELYDRVHLRTTYHNFAKFLESSGNIQAAITNYEKSDTFRFEVPRMLLDNPNQLESYIMKTKDKALRKWWAQYMESNSEMDVALKYYEAANDILSLVRVYCFCGNIEKAAEICNETGDRAASYHLARQFENQDSVREAIHFYTRAQCYSNAIRLAKENDMDNDLMNLALLSKPQDMIDVARYYESMPNMLDKAVVLYHKGGEVSKAVDLCFQSEQFTTLQMVAEDLTENTDPEMLAKCSEFFMEHGQYDKAVDLAVLGKKYVEAMDLCLKYNVIITEELAEKMTLSKDSKDTELRNKILERIAECCMQQGSYHLATKKFTQAGNRLKGMKALLKSGDTEKIVFFAGVSRQREIYVMAANYLQSLDWRKDPDIMKNIISFYTKGRALDSLASFYDACAQVEIDEFQNYEKALGALSESYKCLGRVKTKDGQEEKMAFVKQRVMLIKKFIQARRSFENDSQDAMKQCQLLLEDPDLETAVRIGDVYGLMIEYLAMREQNYSKAYALIEDLRNRVPSANLTFYVDTKTLEVIHKSLNIPLRPDVIANEKPMMNGGGSGGSEDEGEILDEEVEEDIQNGYD